MSKLKRGCAGVLLCLAATLVHPAPMVKAAPPPLRARALGVPFEGAPGELNAITDVAGVTVGQVTLVSTASPGHEVRTGVTAILPRGRRSLDLPVFGAWFALNGAGEMTGTTWLEESGMLEGPVMLTNTHSVGVVHDAVIAWRVRAGAPDASGYWWSNPVVAETWDGYLNDINGFHVHPEHAFAALDSAQGGPVAEGNVGGGTGMICHEFKCGIGTASRRVAIKDAHYMVGVLVQANYGVRDTLTIAGAPVGKELRQHLIKEEGDTASDTGSIIIVVATDAPLLPNQLKRIARRAAMGLARNGSYAGNGSGDIFIAFSTANAEAAHDRPVNTANFVGNDWIDPLFLGTVEATEEAIINSMVAARDMRGQDGHFAAALPHKALQDALRKYNRLIEH
jgi:D-aminopeptidase